MTLLQMGEWISVPGDLLRSRLGSARHNGTVRTKLRNYPEARQAHRAYSGNILEAKKRAVRDGPSHPTEANARQWSCLDPRISTRVSRRS